MFDMFGWACINRLLTDSLNSPFVMLIAFVESISGSMPLLSGNVGLPLENTRSLRSCIFPIMQGKALMLGATTFVVCLATPACSIL